MVRPDAYIDGMQSIRELYTVGHGPSSSHTMGPQRAALRFLERAPSATTFRVALYGSLAATGRGHLTDRVLLDTLGESSTEIQWHPDEVLPFHANGMRFFALAADGSVTDEWEVYSVGGGALAEANEVPSQTGPGSGIYPHTSLEAIMAHCRKQRMELWQYVETCEGEDIWGYLADIWRVMGEAIERGLARTGVLPGDLEYPRKAHTFYKKARIMSGDLKTTGLTFAYALAVAEENASGGEVATAPTCGSAGVVPAVLRSLQENFSMSEEEILRALAVGGLVGNLVKHNASIAGAEVGCQGEIGTACAMAGAMTAYLFGGSLSQIDYAAEMGLEHHLGMTCDPVGGYVQVPCIERNAVSAMRSINLAEYTLFTDGEHRISFDAVVQTMGETGRDLPVGYRETSLAGLAKHACLRTSGGGC